MSNDKFSDIYKPTQKRCIFRPFDVMKVHTDSMIFLKNYFACVVCFFLCNKIEVQVRTF